MYKLMKLVDTVRIPPTLLGEEIMPTIKNALREKLEGQVDKKLGSLVAVYNIDEVGEGHILVGDGAVYYDVTFEAVMFIPELQEIIEGEVVEAVGFGVFVGMGPMDGLLHVSQITDDFISYDAKNARLVTKNGGKSIAEGDHVRARIVAVSINEREPKESKIGLTMRQTALGKLQWLEEARRKKQPQEAPGEETA
ncbi:DNA-directed RNA polymerase [Methanosarcina sp. T3]|uniref:DNA-directed RNA polymerase n=1 Tax=Methanosarcina sp. T3 TaxID=3439062 RepID=UPI003F84D9FB